MGFPEVKINSQKISKLWLISDRRKNWNRFRSGAKMPICLCFLVPEMRWWIIEKWWGMTLLVLVHPVLQFHMRLLPRRSIMYPVQSLKISCNIQKLLQGNAWFNSGIFDHSSQVECTHDKSTGKTSKRSNWKFNGILTRKTKTWKIWRKFPFSLFSQSTF